MIKVSLKEAEGHLGELIEEAAAGQEVVITSDSGPTVRLMLVPQREQEDQRSVEAKLGYAAAKARALAWLEHGYDLGWTPPVEQAALPTLKDLLLAESPRAEIPVPARRSWRRPTPVGFE